MESLYMFLTLSVFVLIANGCLVVDWEHWSMERILTASDVVVYGQETGRFRPDVSDERMDARFEVYCILKDVDTDPDKSEITGEIFIKNVYPVSSCSGTNIQPNQDVILSLARTDQGFVWYEPNPTPDGAAFPADDETLDRVARMSCLQNFTTPNDRNVMSTPKCPLHVYDEATCSSAPIKYWSIYNFITTILALFVMQ